MFSRQEIVQALTQRPVVRNSDTGRQAAVALILLGPKEFGNKEIGELLFIRRAEFPGDPWSGDVAFPGGGVEAVDIDSRATAERETREEIGLILPPESYLGDLGTIGGAYLSVSIACHVYHLKTLPPLQLNAEVANGFAVPFSQLLDPQRNQIRTFTYHGKSRRHPTLNLEGHCERFLWGISYRLLEKFLLSLGIDQLK